MYMYNSKEIYQNINNDSLSCIKGEICELCIS